MPGLFFISTVEPLLISIYDRQVQRVWAEIPQNKMKGKRQKKDKGRNGWRNSEK